MIYTKYVWIQRVVLDIENSKTFRSSATHKDASRLLYKIVVYAKVWHLIHNTYKMHFVKYVDC